MQQPDQKYKILISGGGTGGHVFPAIAIAEALKQKVQNIDILFVGAKGKMEMEKVPMAGFPIKGLWISGFQRSFSLRNLLFPVKVLWSLWVAGRIIGKFKPHAVIGVGGYASGPTCKMAARKKIPVILQEQNSFPGMTNKLLSREAAKIFVAYPGMEKYFPKEKIVVAGNPVRQNVINIEGKRNQAIAYFELDRNKPTALIVGGSQGARSVNEAISENLGLLAMNNIQLIWQTGELFAPMARKIVLEKLNGKTKNYVRIKPFISKMDFAYAAADVVVSRAGAIAISELSATAKPAILIPLPSAAENHQTKNAEALERREAAIHLKDSEAKEKVGLMLTELIKNDEMKNRLSSNIQKLAKANPAAIIADEVLKLIAENDNAQ
jgi:UDP-N-acetylglucosamine--N-acetylmuramyl-(pentapeptide) pyrophosphoryl-undecaprenol N-acetylglucosamine transferase